MVARTAREILRWLEGLYLTYPVIIPKWDLSNGYTYAEILHAYFPKDINMFAFINGRSLNARLLNWTLIKQFIAKKNLPISIQLIDATLHGKDGGAEGLLEQTYQLLTNKKPFIDSPYERDESFSDHPYQQNLSYYEQAHASKSIKNNLKISELLTDPSYAYQAKRSQAILDQARADRQAMRTANPRRFRVKPTLAERCLRQPLQPDSNAQDWYLKSFDLRSRSVTSITNKSSSVKHQSRHTSANVPKKRSPSQQRSDQEQIEANEDNALYKEIILRQHAVPLGDLLQPIES
ncbi:unnamed protein product [Rotaria sordida]|uniref:Calponin-homology (CH) domain-containing protein n=1 Tax=Rotaria sordida TaxID=392033 RepID=A0A818N622_9BILA|nr:unnamed protein product [Rotaria sordida]CAF1187152.1 unnamed protein product [Rotaria sordida]CAF3600145.1 unnamed protein product [Rotaria sordida]CAF3681912.1 unnamed protein product [Rotaria sordida]